MKNKDAIIRNIFLKIRKIVDVHLSIDEQPMQFNDDIILTPKEVKIIQVIGKSNKINIKELGDYFNTSKSAASQIISKLVKKGFVQKEKSFDNNKEYRLYLTKTGNQAFSTYQAFRNSYISKLTETLNSSFDKNELKAADNLLEILESKMEEQINKMM